MAVYQSPGGSLHYLAQGIGGVFCLLEYLSRPIIDHRIFFPKVKATPGLGKIIQQSSFAIDLEYSQVRGLGQPGEAGTFHEYLSLWCKQIDLKRLSAVAAVIAVAQGQVWDTVEIVILKSERALLLVSRLPHRLVLGYEERTVIELERLKRIGLSLFEERESHRAFTSDLFAPGDLDPDIIVF